MTTSAPEKYHTDTPDSERDVDARDLADCLEFARNTLSNDASLPDETRSELIQSLGYAEAALRRAAAERKMLIRIKSLLSVN